MRSEPAGERGAMVVRLVLGLLVLALGAITLGNNLGWIDGSDIFRLYLFPGAFVAIGVALLVQPADTGASRWWSLAWIVAGAWIHLHQRGWIEVEFWDVLLPGALLVLGAMLVWRVVAGDRPVRRRSADHPGARLSSFAVMAGNEVRAVTEGFRGAELVAFMGGIVLDLTQAKLEEGVAVVDAFVMWGGVEIRVPRDWSVESRVMPFMAAYEDKTGPSTAPPVGRLVVRGAVVMGGIEVRN